MDYYVNLIKKDNNNKNIKINGVYLIEKAIFDNNIKAIKYLLSINANIFIPKLLFNPIKFNNIKIINLLNNYSSIIFDILDNKKHNALHYAIKFNNSYLINKLINQSNLFNLDIYNNTYLHYAIKYNNKEFIDNFFNLISKNNYNNLIKLLEIKNNSGFTPLMFIIYKNFDFNYIFNIFKLLSNNLLIDLNINDNNNFNILNYIINYIDKNNICKLFYLFDNNFLSFINWNNQDNNGNNILHHCFINNIFNDLEFIFNNINLNKYNINFEIPLLLFIKLNKDELKNNLILKNNEILFYYNRNNNKYVNLTYIFQQSNLVFNDKNNKNIIYYLLKFNVNKDLLSYINDDIINNEFIDNVKYNKFYLKDLDKYNIFKFKNIINHNIITNINYTTLPFDIICSLLLLKSNNYNILIDFNKINYLSSLFETCLQYFLIWKNNNLINSNLLNNIIYFNDFVCLFIIIDYDNINHANILIFNNNKKECYRFDPYGYLYDNIYNLNKLDNIIKKYCDKYNYSYNFYNEIIGVQQYEKKNKFYINDLNGYCLAWCLIFAEYFILNNKYSLTYFINNFNNMFNNEEYYNFKIKNIQNNISKIRDIILNKLNININDYCNNINNPKLIKNMFGQLFKIFNKFNKYIN